LDTQPDAAPSIGSALGLSKRQLDESIKAMLVVVRRVGCPVHIHPLEVVNDAFVVALSKPISERPSITEWKNFVAWMCTLAEYAALTNRKSKHRRLLGSGHAEDDIAAHFSILGQAEVIDARHDLHKVFTVLKPADQELLKALFVEGKTIQEMVIEQNEPWSTVKSRSIQALNLLYAALQALTAAIILLFPKNARAQGARWAQRLSRLLAQATPATGAMVVTLVCGVMVPSASIGTSVSQGSTVSVLSAPPSATMIAAIAPLGPAKSTEVEPEKPIAIDEREKQWSAADMNSFKIAKYVQLSLVPFAFLVAPAVTQVACAGAEQQAPPPQEPEEQDDSLDTYEIFCTNTKFLGGKCPSKADWCASMGKRPATKGCK
jgi:DNA-directed RNA polymerase specialized sigma24 family protein